MPLHGIFDVPGHRIGLALGAWGAVQATAAGIGVASAGIVRDVIVGWNGAAGVAAQTPYTIVFMIEVLFLAAAVVLLLPVIKTRKKARTGAALARSN